MREDYAEEPQEIRRRMQKLFHDFYHAGISEPDTGYAFINHGQQATNATSHVAAGGKHEHKD